MIEETSVAVKMLHEAALCDSEWEQIVPAVHQSIDVVTSMRKNAQAHLRYDIIACPMRARVEEIEKRLNTLNTNPKEASL